MPPKPAAGKKAGEELDMSDLASLPKANVCLFRVLFGKFKATASRQKISEHVLKNFPEERVRQLSRQDIIDYGKSKGIYEEPESTKGLTVQQMLAQSAADKIFELNVAARKTKKDKQVKLEELQAAAAATEGAQSLAKIEPDNDLVDQLLYLPDYPKTKAEALAFSQYGCNINCIFEIFEVKENIDGTAPSDLRTAKEVTASTEEEEVAHQAKFTAELGDIKQAIAVAARNAPVRNTAIFRVPFCDVELVEIKQTDDGDVATNTLTAEQSFMRAFMNDYVEKFAAYNMNFIKFKANLEVHQLMPEKAVMQELATLRRAHHEYVQWKFERDLSKQELDQQVLSQEQKEILSHEEQEEFAQQKQSQLNSVEQELLDQKKEDAKNQVRIKELLKLATVSLDEGRDKSTYFSDKVYKADFIPNNETVNCVPSIMSAIVSQIGFDNSQQHSQFSNQSTQAETIDDLFEHFQKEIAIDTNLMEREGSDEEFEEPQLKGFLPHQCLVHETLDTSTNPILTLPAGMAEEMKDHALKIAEREKEAAKHLVLPGCNRFMMPDVPSKSERLRKFENPQFYPFSTLPIEDAERTMQLKAFQQLIKSNGIDEQQKPKDRLGKLKIFERKYDQFFEESIFRQVLQEALLQDPDITQMYYARTDQLLLVLHNKINNQKRASDNLDKPHGLKKWRSAYRVLPSFQNWIEFFGHNAVVQQQEYVPKDPSEPPVKYTLDEEMVPQQMLDVDDQKIQNIEQTLRQFFPDDNSIINSEEYLIGGERRKKSIVYKDKYTFGLRQVDNKASVGQPAQNGLVSYKQVGNHEFWLNFSDQESKMLIETVKAQKNPQKLVEVKPPTPTAEEIAAKEEAAKVAAAAAAKKNPKGAPVEVIEEKEPEPVFEEEQPNFLDSLFNEDDINSAIGPCINMTMKNGLIVRHMPNGDVVQIHDATLIDRKPRTEIDRVYMMGGKQPGEMRGIVVRHFANLDAEILYPNGEFAKFEREEMKWTITNEKGFRREYKDGVYSDLPRINCLSQTTETVDAETGEKALVVTKVREDNVVLIAYEGGNLYCQHADGTQIFTQEGGAQIRIEKDSFAPVMYQETEDAEDEDDWLDTELLKSKDGWSTLVFLPDGCQVKSIRFYKSSADRDRIVMKHLYLRADYSAVIVDSDGDFRVISTNARAAINEEDERARLGMDCNYLQQMYSPEGVYTPGVYYGHLSEHSEKVHLAIRDFERPFFYKVNNQNGLEKCKYTPFEKNNEYLHDHASTKPFETERDIEHICIGKNPFTRNFIYPRMFIISPNGQGIELLAQEQVDQFLKHSQHREDVLSTSRVEYVDNTQLNSIQVMNKVTSLQETQLDNQKMNKLPFPEYAEPYVIPKKSEEELKLLKPLQDVYRFNNISEYTSFEPIKQNSFIDDYMRFQDWKQSQIRYDSEFGIVHQAPKDQVLDLDEIEENEFYAKRINLKIFKERALQKPAFDRTIFKTNFKQCYNTDDEIVSFRKKMTTVEREENEILAEIERRKLQDASKVVEAEEAQKELLTQQWREEKKTRAIQKINQKLKHFNGLKNTKTFSSQYHKSRAGIEYFKLYPSKPPTEEVMMRMSQRINRSQQNIDRENGAYEGSQKSGAALPGENHINGSHGDNPIVALEPENLLKETSVQKTQQYNSVSKQLGDDEKDPALEISLFKQEKIYLEQLEQERVLKAEEHHVIKTKDFNVYGQLRTEKPFVKSTQKSTVASELNEKFITTECITDRRVKISSMANRQYINAPSVEDVRKQGQHQMILQAITKKQTFSELINQANSMVTSVLHDNLKRSVNILPSVCKFGSIKQGTENQMYITVKNEDSLSQRINIKPTQDKRIVVVQETYGPIAPGMTKRISITIRCPAGAEGLQRVREEVIIMTKTDHFKVPVEAMVLAEAEFDAQNEQKLHQTGASLGNSRVRHRLMSGVAQGRNQRIMADFKAQLAAEEQKNAGQQLTSKTDGSKLGGQNQEFGDMEDQ